MIDPVSIGTLVTSALSMAAEAALKGSVGEAAKEVYQTLKAKIAQWAGRDLDCLEKEPTSKGRQITVAEILDRQSELDQMQMRTLAEQLITALKQAGGIGLDVGYLEAMEIQLGNIQVAGGTGARFREAKIGGVFRTGDINVQVPPGKV